MGLCGLFVVSRVLLSSVCGFVMACLVYVWRVCVCFGLKCLCVVLVMYCVMVHGLCLCALCVCVGVSFNVLVCGVNGLMIDVVWFAVVCDCVACVVFVSCVCDLFVNVLNGVV